MSENQSAAYLSAIHQLLVTYFTLDELHTLCFQLGVDYENLGGPGKSTKARELVTHLANRDRLPELRTAVAHERPRVAWPAAPSAPPVPDPTPDAGWALAPADFDRLAGLLAALPEFRASTRRIDFLDDVFAGSPRRADILGLLDLDGAPRGVAVRLIERLMRFGQDEPGRESLAVLVNKLLAYTGGGADADFLRGLLNNG
ncbi:MAG: hypothetical protein KC425_10810 [Anaerolineales bacterium]|nr:hypothetical protein [Anaerolineales bacterium]